MLESHKLPSKLRRGLEKELESSESIRWVEQPIARFFNRNSLGICLALLVPAGFFSFSAIYLMKQANEMKTSLWEMISLVGVLVFCMGVAIPVLLLIFIPIYTWLDARQTVYVITNKRAFSLTVGRTTTVQSFVPAGLRAISRRENQDGSGDVIVYTHQSEDYDGDTHTQELGFNQVHDAKTFEKLLRQISTS